MTPIPFPLSTAPGERPQESGGRLINCYAKVLGEHAGRQSSRRRVSGLTNFATSSQTGPRGLIEISGVLYSAWSGKLYKCTSTGGALTLVGTLAGTTPVQFARNNAATPDQVVVTENGAFSFTSTGVSSFADADLPQPNSVTSIDGYLVFGIGDGRAFATDLNAVTVNSLSFGKAEYKPDSINRVVAYSGILLFCGPQTIEVWTDAGLTPFPFTRATILDGPGLISGFACAGFEDGFGGPFVYVGSDCGVWRLNGYTPQKISPPDLDHLIEAVADKTDLDLCVYTSDGQRFISISCDDWTWEFNLNTQKWHERKSYLLTRWLGRFGYKAFDKWLVQDNSGGDIHYLNSGDWTENGSPLIARIESGPVLKFPARTQVARADFDFVTGVGSASGSDPSETDPDVEISWSDDGGLNWSNPLIRKLGRQSTASRVTVLNTGLSTVQGRRWRLDIPTAPYVGLMGGTQSDQARV